MSRLMSALFWTILLERLCLAAGRTTTVKSEPLSVWLNTPFLISLIFIDSLDVLVNFSKLCTKISLKFSSKNDRLTEILGTTRHLSDVLTQMFTNFLPVILRNWQQRLLRRESGKLWNVRRPSQWQGRSLDQHGMGCIRWQRRTWLCPNGVRSWDWWIQHQQRNATVSPSNVLATSDSNFLHHFLGPKKWFPECTWASLCVSRSSNSQKLVFCLADRDPSFSSSATSSSPNTCQKLSRRSPAPSWTATMCSKKSASHTPPTKIAQTSDSSASAYQVGRLICRQLASLVWSTKWTTRVWRWVIVIQTDLISRLTHLCSCNPSGWCWWLSLPLPPEIPWSDVQQNPFIDTRSHQVRADAFRGWFGTWSRVGRRRRLPTRSRGGAGTKAVTRGSSQDEYSPECPNKGV